MSKLSLCRTLGLVCVFCALAVTGSAAQTITTIVSFTQGTGPGNVPLVQGFNGDFYATGQEDGGKVLEITPGGELTTIYSFCSQPDCADGMFPYAGLVQATNGDLYGTTVNGGTTGNGTIFQITPGGKLTTLHTFCNQRNSKGYCLDGFGLFSGLVQGTNENFYGVTQVGGTYNYGTVFEITAEGKLTTLHSFDFNDGSDPSGLVQATNGNFYGTTAEGGSYNSGTVFEITPEGKRTTLHNFHITDGRYAMGLVQATNGNFYGTTGGGGSHNHGTVFEVTPGGKLTTLHSFCSQTTSEGRFIICLDGIEANASVVNVGLVQATDGNIYGTTQGGGANNGGTIFQITPEGDFNTVYSFCSQSSCIEGEYPAAGLVQATDGNLYGTTDNGGTDDYGTFYSLSEGLGPFVETLPTSGAVGAAVTILGNNLTGTSSVTFNGTSAKFTVVSGTEITTTVPSGATTGKVEVTTPSGILASNVNFRVT
jgi:uncharacterized repeat protein (TIGR03803 family)